MFVWGRLRLNWFQKPGVCVLPKQVHFLSKLPAKHKLKYRFMSHSFWEVYSKLTQSLSRTLTIPVIISSPMMGLKRLLDLEEVHIPQYIPTFHCPQSTDRGLNGELHYCVASFLSTAQLLHLSSLVLFPFSIKNIPTSLHSVFPPHTTYLSAIKYWQIIKPQTNHKLLW